MIRTSPARNPVSCSCGRWNHQMLTVYRVSICRTWKFWRIVITIVVVDQTQTFELRTQNIRLRSCANFHSFLVNSLQIPSCGFINVQLSTSRERAGFGNQNNKNLFFHRLAIQKTIFTRRDLLAELLWLPLCHIGNRCLPSVECTARGIKLSANSEAKVCQGVKHVGHCTSVASNMFMHGNG